MLKTTTMIDIEGCIIATTTYARSKNCQRDASCVYDGDDYAIEKVRSDITANEIEDMRYAARTAWEKRFQNRK